MELKSYQKKVIADLTRYLELLNETKNYEAAFRFFWQEKSAYSFPCPAGRVHGAAAAAV